MIEKLHEVFIRLMLTQGIGTRTAINLCKALKEAGYETENYGLIFNNTNFITQLIKSGLRLNKTQIDNLQKLPAQLDKYMHQHKTWLAQSEKHHFITIYDEYYPQALFDLPDPPIALYVKAQKQNLAQLNQIGISVVGSRQATPEGLETAFKFSNELSQHGFPIISGLADGIDAKAHEGALYGKNATIAVIGTGIDIVYPSKNKELFNQISEYGCIISDFLLGEAPKPANFPRRNRIIAGLCKGIIVVEANIKSGSLITARIANELGRDVFAIPNSIYATSSKGCHALIKDGAILLESVQDVLNEWWIDSSKMDIENTYITPKPHNQTSALPNKEVTHTEFNKPAIQSQEKNIINPNYSVDSLEQKIISVIAYNPISIDKISELVGIGISISEIQSALFIMEMNGDVEKVEGGGMYKKK
jgi:DNA processing protein